MLLLGDYEGLGVAIAQMFWLILTLPAAAQAIVGFILARRREPWRKTAIFLGLMAVLLQALGVIGVWLAFQDERARLGSFAERFRPSPAVWIVSGVVMIGAAATVTTAALRSNQPRSEQPRLRDPQHRFNDQH